MEMQVVYDLIKAGEEVRIDYGKGITALHWAADFSNLPSCVDAASRRANAARMLLNAGADANARDSSGNTPLHVARNTEAWPVFQVLLQHKGTDVNILDASGNPLLMLLVESHCETKVIEDLIKAGASVNAKDTKQQHTALHSAAIVDKYDELNLLLKYGADVNAVGICDNTALHLAGFIRVLHGEPLHTGDNLDHNKTKLYKSLLDAGADASARNSDGATPLYEAVTRKDMNAFMVLLSRTPNLNTHTKHGGMTPLIAAVEHGMEHMVYYLITAGADVNARNRDGATALHFAARLYKSIVPKNSEHDIATSRAEAARMLLEAGADPNIPDNCGDTVLHEAIKSKTWPVFNHLVLGHSRVDVNAHSARDGKTPLMMMIESNPGEGEFQWIVDHTANINAKDKKLQTALHYAVELEKDVELVILLENGAEVDVRDCDGQTPLFVAAREGLYDTCDVLIKIYFANRDIPDNRGRRPRDIASEMDYEEIVMLLNESMAAG